MKKLLLSFLILCAVYVAFRVGALDASYYQDELDWVVGILGHTQIDPHPPLSSLIYFAGKAVVGLEHLRIVPLLVGVANLFLLWVVMRRRAGEHAAYIAAGLFTISFASVLGSLMIDVDGQWLPFLFLLTVYAFDRWRSAPTEKTKLGWSVLGTFAVSAGLLTKFSFVIAAGALALEMLLTYRPKWRQLQFWYSFFGYWFGVLIVMAAGILAGRFLTDSYSTGVLASYTSRFFTIDRGWLQIVIQVMKATFYFSPALVLLPILLRRDRMIVVRPFLIFVGIAVLFYIALFDFSAASLDRYLLILAVPLSAIAGAAIADVFRGWRPSRSLLGACIAAGAFLVAIQFVQHMPVPQYPKEAWFGRVLSGRWTFLMPFTGGSGPLGFYVSWLAIGLAWVGSFAAAVAVFVRRSWAPALVCVVIALSFVYNLSFSEEYQYGFINGSAQRLLENAMTFVEHTPAITKVITYNDIGAYELQQMGKYERRLYAAPKFEASYTEILRTFRGHYLVIDIPLIATDSRFVQFWRQCPVVFSERDKAITATIYDCRKPVPVP